MTNDVKPATDAEIEAFIEGYSMVDNDWAAVVTVGQVRGYAARLRADAARIARLEEALLDWERTPGNNRTQAWWYEWERKRRAALDGRDG